MAKKKTERDCTGEAYQLKITLSGSRPPIWRRVVVPADLTLAGLHEVIQVAMGWEFSHLHMFEIGGKRYQEPGPYGGDEFEDLDEADYRLCDVAPREKMKFRYEYDFGDGWRHDVLVEKRLSAIESPETMVCLTGKNRCPPEDSGGLWGYYAKLHALSDPNDPEHKDIKEWMGEIDPTELDLEAVNRNLARLKGSK